MFCVVRWRDLTFFITKVLAYLFSSVTTFQMRTLKVGLPTPPTQYCLRILPTFWIKQLVVSSIGSLPCSMKRHLVLTFKWTQLSENDVFYSFDYRSLCCDLLNLITSEVSFEVTVHAISWDAIVIVINDYNMTRDIEELYNDDKVDDSRSENDIVINGVIETVHLMCECANIINWLWHVNNDIKLRKPNCKVKLISSSGK